jgi:hypothetical protein
MQSDEVLSIERENGSSLGCRKGEDLLICRRLVGLAGFLNSENVVTKSPEFSH